MLGDVTSLNITTLEAGVRVGDTFAGAPLISG